MIGQNDKWEMYLDKRGEHRWRRKSTNGNIVGSSCEGYSQKPACIANAERHGMNGNIRKLGEKDKWEFYQDRRGEHRWRRKAVNGQVTGASSESYKQ